MKYAIYILMIIMAWQVSCNECSNCEPFTEEPYVLVRFLNAADSSRRILVIDSVNQVPTEGFRHFSDTTWEFKFPLNMHADTSEFNLVMRDTTHLDSISYNHFIQFSYERQFVRRDDNYIISECNLNSIKNSFFRRVVVDCKEDDKCISNNAKATFYY